MNSGHPEHLPQCLRNLNWDHAMGADGRLQSALGSIVSPQSSSSPAAATPAESLAFYKLVGGLHGVANSGEEISPQSHFGGTPLNFPQKLNLSMMGSLYQHHQAFGSLPMPGHQMLPSHVEHMTNDPGFADRAAMFSSFDGRNYGSLGGPVAAPETGRFSRSPSSKSLTISGLQVGLLPEVNKEMNNGELVNAREESSVSDPTGAELSMAGPPGSNGKKRKAPPKGKGKDASLANSSVDPPKTIEEDKSCTKRSRAEGNDSENETKVEQNDGASTSGNNGGSKQGKDSSKLPEPPKDYIHVRARRGQATDSHSLAERVRREKISQRMKLLQDLVPGCNKVTGKAVMLDEIINYVQSLQRQVEFLSMKLATVNPHLDFNNLADLLPKDIHQTGGSIPNSVYSLEASGIQSSFANQPQLGSSLHCGLNNGVESQNSLNLMDSRFHQSLASHQPFLDELENASSQLGNFWEDDLQSVVQMDVGQGQELATSSHGFHGPLPTGHMKIEL